MKNKWITGTTVAGLAVGASLFVLSNDAPLSKFEGKEVIDAVPVQDGEIKFAYKGKALSPKITDKELKEKRNNHSFTELLSINPDSSQTLRTITYSGAAFFKQGEEWHEVEYGTTTEDDFEDNLDIPLSRRLSGQVYADTIFSGAGDGNVTYSVDANWDNTHNPSIGSGVHYMGDNFGVYSTRILASTFEIQRGFLPFDTSSIPSDAIISAATLNLYPTLVENDDNDGDDWLNIVQTSQASETVLTAADFDQAGAIDNPTEGATRIDITSISTGGYKTWTLNSTGLSWIKRDGETSNCGSTPGWTCLGLREGHDAIDSAINAANPAYSGIILSTSEATGTSQDPYLDITYTIPALTSTFLDIGSANVNVGSGGILNIGN